MNVTIKYTNEETGREEKLENILKGYFIAVSPKTGNRVLVSAENDDIHIGVVDVARHINPQDIGIVLEFLRRETPAQDTTSYSMVTAFLERLICRLGERDQPLLTWMYEHKELLLPELPIAWEAVKANHEIRDVNRGIFSIENAENAVMQILTK